MSREILAHGTTLRHAFAEAMGAVLALDVDQATVEAREVREVRAHGKTPEALLAHWIGECSYVLDVEGFVCRSIDLAVFDAEPKPGAEPLRLHAFLHGEPFDPARHEPASIVPVDPGQISITTVEDGYEIRFTVR